MGNWQRVYHRWGVHFAITMIVKRFVNEPVSSNAYILQFEGDKRCLIVDPGSRDAGAMDNYINVNKLQPQYVVLTHEHFDHTWGTNRMAVEHGAKVVCSKYAVERLMQPLNYFNLLYFSDPSPFFVEKIDVEVLGGETLDFGGHTVNFVYTPGHSPGSICLCVDDKLFSGDTLILDAKPHFDKKVGASKSTWKDSVAMLLQKFPDAEVYPGHGTKFTIREWEETFKGYMKDIC